MKTTNNGLEGIKKELNEPSPLNQLACDMFDIVFDINYDERKKLVNYITALMDKAHSLGKEEGREEMRALLIKYKYEIESARWAVKAHSKAKKRITGARLLIDDLLEDLSVPTRGKENDDYRFGSGFGYEGRGAGGGGGKE